MKIKLFQGVNVSELEKEVNAFLIEKDIVDMFSGSKWANIEK